MQNIHDIERLRLSATVSPTRGPSGGVSGYSLATENAVTANFAGRFLRSRPFRCFPGRMRHVRLLTDLPSIGPAGVGEDGDARAQRCERDAGGVMPVFSRSRWSLKRVSSRLRATGFSVAYLLVVATRSVGALAAPGATDDEIHQLAVDAHPADAAP